MTIAPQQESLGVALWVERHHGDNWPVFIAEQIGALALQGDAAGIARWRAVAVAWQNGPYGNGGSLTYRPFVLRQP